MMDYTVAELAELLREYSHMGLSPDQSLALAEHLDELVQADETVPPMTIAQVTEWRTYSTLTEAAEAAGLEFAEEASHAERETIARDYFVALAGRWSVVEVGGGASYLVRDGGAR